MKKDSLYILFVILLFVFGCCDEQKQTTNNITKQESTTDINAETFWKQYALYNIQIDELKKEGNWGKAVDLSIEWFHFTNNANSDWWSDKYRNQYSKWYYEVLSERLIKKLIKKVKNWSDTGYVILYSSDSLVTYGEGE